MQELSTLSVLLLLKCHNGIGQSLTNSLNHRAVSMLIASRKRTHIRTKAENSMMVFQVSKFGFSKLRHNESLTFSVIWTLAFKISKAKAQVRYITVGIHGFQATDRLSSGSGVRSMSSSPTQMKITSLKHWRQSVFAKVWPETNLEWLVNSLLILQYEAKRGYPWIRATWKP